MLPPNATHLPSSRMRVPCRIGEGGRCSIDAEQRAGSLPAGCLADAERGPLRLLLAALLRSAVAVLAACTMTAPAGAHGFGQRYELPLPLGLYLFGGAAV